MMNSRHFARALAASASVCVLVIGASGGLASAADLPVKAPPLAPEPIAWEGLYAGVSYGAGLFKANAATAFHSVNAQALTFPTGSVRTITSVQDFASTASGSNWGAQSDIYLGYNFRIGSSVVAGFQVEGTIANERAQLDGTSNSVLTTTTVNTPPGSVSTSSTITTATIRDSLAERWAVAALGRVGVLLAPRDLVYVIGGYTYGGFEWNGRSFDLNGATVGAGWEHEIAPSWTLKAEYRYTAFESKDLSRPSNSSSTQSDVSGGTTTTTIANFTSATTDRASGISLHALRFGITHYFDGGPASAPAAMVTKAPAVAAPWEGLYAGVSYGPSWLKAATSQASNSVSTRVVTSSTGAVTTSTTPANLTSAGSGNNLGSLSDILVGYNFRIGGNVVAGVQVEGTVADIDTALNTTQVQATAATTFTDVTAVAFTDNLAQRWAVSGLGRLGVLIDPRDLIYAVGGYTYGGFEWNNRTFGLHGATVGAGWEREVAPGWTFKAEYRYTRFQDRDLPRNTASTSTQTSVSTTGAVTTTVTNTTGALTDHVSGVASHTLRFGITHYFGAGVPVLSAYAKAAPPPPAFTGLYGGVSVGLMSMQAKAATTTNEAFGFTETIPGIAATDAESLNLASNTSGRHAGAVADVLVGYNVALAPKFIAGVQFERSLAHGAVLGAGSFAQTFSDVFVLTPPGGAAGTETTTGTASGTRFLDVQSRWMMSALLRAGVLVDPRDFVYAIGGWTYGGFTTGVFTTGLHPFNLNGPTVGIGIEREVVPTWTLRAEYRYTHFLPRDVSAAQRTTELQNAGTAAINVTDVFTETDRISVDMHAVRIGIAHYFSTY